MGNLRDLEKYRTSATVRTAAEVTEKTSKFTGEYFIKKEIKIFTPAEGDNIVRTLPATWADKEKWGRYWAILIWVHYGVGSDNSAVLCPKRMYNEECPICEERNAAFKEGDKEYAKKLFPTERYLQWVINRKDEKAGPLLWAQPKKLNTDIGLQIMDKTTGALLAIDDIFEGYDVSFVKDVPKNKNEFANYKGVSVSRHASPLGTEEEIVKWLDFIEKTPVDTTLMCHSYEQIKILFAGKKNKPVETQQGKTETSNVSVPPAPPITPPPTNEVMQASAQAPQKQTSDEVLQALKAKYLKKE